MEDISVKLNSDRQTAFAGEFDSIRVGHGSIGLEAELVKDEESSS
jgi:hypothetical protein